MGDERLPSSARRPPYVLIPSWLLLEDLPGVTASIIATYVALCSFIYRRSKCSDRYSRWSPGIQAIAKRSRQHPSTVKRNVKWLEREGFIYRKRRFNQASTITLVNDPATFRATLAGRGKDAAVKEAEAKLEESAEEARRERARERAKATGSEGEKVAQWSHKNKRTGFPRKARSGRESRQVSPPRSPNEPTPGAVWSHENYPSGGDHENQEIPGTHPAGAFPPATTIPEKTEDGEDGTEHRQRRIREGLAMVKQLVNGKAMPS
ncbi:MAG: MarR family transcriptional regulator [Acidobacteria bacterium]|nr:MarR family transcriptional regulator [Acidobacteriota bacterium]